MTRNNRFYGSYDADNNMMDIEDVSASALLDDYSEIDGFSDMLETPMTPPMNVALNMSPRQYPID